MEIKPTLGIAELIFGMKPKDVENLWGKPNENFKDEDENIIYIYNERLARLTFYHEEENKLSLILCSNPALTYQNKKVMHEQETKAVTNFSNLKNWTKDQEDITTIYFNEDNWLYLQMEFGYVTKIEMGVVTKNIDEFDWKF
ncbi:MAG: hypothetical protein ACOVQ2_02665 [Flavobacterium sp.]|jgi:hypothetical protein